MNGKKAKKIRKLVYNDKNFRERKHTKLSTGQIVSDDNRRKYQRAKNIS